MIIRELLANLAILSSLLFLYIQLTKCSPLTTKSHAVRKVFLGILGGLLANILMQYSMDLGEAIVDLRHIPIILLAYYGGPVPAITAMIFVMIGRLTISVNISAYAALISILCKTLASLYISRTNMSKRTKIIWMLTLSNSIFSIVVLFVLKDVTDIFLLLAAYWAISYVAGFTAFYIVQYLRNSQKLFERYKSESTTDVLTGLNNVRKFDETFNSLLERAQEKHEKLSFLYIDIDFFKRINDTYGHLEGDVVLKEVGHILKESTRSFDIISRNGGEEFTVILLDCPLERAVEISERIRRNVEAYPFMLSTGEPIHITVSIGAACFRETTMEPHLLIDDADRALYEAKRTGRNKVCVAS